MSVNIIKISKSLDNLMATLSTLVLSAKIVSGIGSCRVVELKFQMQNQICCGV
jgi:hypothetical protein